MFETSQPKNNDGLVHRILDGLGSNKYRQVDYDEMMEKVLQKKFEANSSMIKMGRLKGLSKCQQKDTNTKHHQVAWRKEMLRLKDIRHIIELDIAEHIVQNAKSCLPIYVDYDYLIAQQAKKMTAFKEGTLEPVWNLCEDLKIWLQENVTQTCNIKNCKLQNKAREILQTVKSVSWQQEELMGKLSNERTKLEEEIRIVMQNTGVTVDAVVKVEQGVPDEAVLMPCPDENLKFQLLSEFFKIDESFEDRLESLREQYNDVYRQGENGGWSESDHLEFTSVLSQYAKDLPQRNALVFDRLQRQFPGKSNSELLIHQKWYTSMRFYLEHRNALMRSWQRCREELQYKLHVIFTEACCIYEAEEMQTESKEKQKNICDQLYEKVSKWREQKYEQMVLEIHLQEEKRKEAEEKIKLTLEKKKQERNRNKQKIQEYRNQKSNEKQEETDRCLKRLEELQKELAEQAKYDWKRIKYRKEQIQKKILAQEQQKLENSQEEKEKEKRLEALREQVRVIADWNPARVHYGTEAWHAKVCKNPEKYISMHQPLFNTHTYTSDQVTSDPRFRLEEKLREAALLSSDYARVAMNQLKPLHPPRPDLHSTVFKMDD